MSLKNIRLPEAKVQVGIEEDGSPVFFTVRGLSFNDIEALVRAHGSHLADFYNLLTGHKGDITVDSVFHLAMPVLESVPELVADMIACASGDPADAPVAATLPFPAQLDAVEKLLKLTFDASGGPKKVLETVLRLAQGANGLVSSVRAPTT